jgi:hypothetical protein
MGEECNAHGRNAKFRMEYIIGKNLIVALHFVEKTALTPSPQNVSIIFRVGGYIRSFNLLAPEFYI